MIYNKLIKSGCATHRRSVLISGIHTLSQSAHGLQSHSLSYTKIMQTSGKKVYFQFPECSLSYTKMAQGECNGKGGKTCFYNFDTAEPKLILYKDN